MKIPTKIDISIGKSFNVKAEAVNIIVDHITQHLNLSWWKVFGKAGRIILNAIKQISICNQVSKNKEVDRYLIIYYLNSL